MKPGMLYRVLAPSHTATILAKTRLGATAAGDELEDGDFVILLDRRVAPADENPAFEMDRAQVLSRLGVGWVFTEDIHPCAT